MVYKVLVVDDSSFYRRRVSEIINTDPELEVVGEARDGRDALLKIKSLSPDVVTMDVEMPVMDGISAVKRIMAENPLPVLMFSSLTHHGAQATLDALEAGALDFLPKKFEDIAQNRHDAVRLLCSKIRMIARRGITMRRGVSSSPIRTMPDNAPKTAFFRSSSILSGNQGDVSSSVSPRVSRSKSIRCVAIGASTGGPVALQKVLQPLPATFPHPILLIQHMPGTFTKAFAERLNGHCQIEVKEAEHGDVLKPGMALLAPGGKQMTIEKYGAGHRVVIHEPDANDKVSYKPSVDITLESVAQCYGGDVLSVILTGMGADGREGCRVLRDKGATIWAQDEASCVVYGMPQAIVSANIAHKSLNLDEISNKIMAEVG